MKLLDAPPDDPAPSSPTPRDAAAVAAPSGTMRAGRAATPITPVHPPAGRAPGGRVRRIIDAGSRLDPRLFQIVVLGSLLVYGMVWLGFDIEPSRAAAILATALMTQMAGTVLTGGARFDPRSALISGLSLCLLLRTEVLQLALLAAVIAVGSKFAIRVRGKHVFNPTNLAIVLMIALTGRVWVSPGQWGSAAIFAFLLASAGALVVNRAARADVTWTFLAAWGILLVGRSLWLGDPLAIPLHRLESGALVLFAFFMISDPRTTPDSRAGRMLFAVLVAAGAYVVQFKLFATNGLLWSLAVCSLAVPLIDWILPGSRYQWRPGTAPEPARERTARMPTIAAVIALSLAALLTAPSAALAFCGFYVAKADAKLFNRASQVVLARHDDKTVITMAADYRGDLKDFAMVVPVPTVLERGQIRVADRALIDHLDAYTAPRLVEYFDENPCAPRIMYAPAPRTLSAKSAMEVSALRDRAKSLGVTIEAQYTVGEYDILILSAVESSGLETWLTSSGYRLPAGAGPVLGSYLKQGMKFFVARVNLAEQAKTGYSYLRPLQMAFETPKFMLPIRLGTLNADGDQEMFVYTLTKKGRVETTNYRTVPLPTDMGLPVHIKEQFPNFYRAMFTEQVKKHDMRVVFLEYAWDMAWCDPCAADPLSPDQLRQLGVHWIGESVVPPQFPTPRPRMGGGPVDVFVTRLHVRYNEAKFPDDLVFQETANRSNFQGRYVLRHPWKGDENCEAAVRYRADLKARAEKEALALASLTGWPIEDIRKKMGALPTGSAPEDTRPWWKKLWPDNAEKQGKQ
jgi:hypothetical protein